MFFYDAVSAWFLLKAGGVLIFDDYPVGDGQVAHVPSGRSRPSTVSRLIPRPL